MGFFSNQCCEPAGNCNIDLDALQTVICNALEECGATGGATGVFTEGQLDILQIEGKVNNFSLPAGAHYALIYNTTGTSEVHVNGQVLGPRNDWKFESKVDYVNGVQDFVEPIVFVNTDSVYVYVKIAFPSAKNVDYSVISLMP